MRSDMGGASALERAIQNLVFGYGNEEVVIPKLVKIEDMLWKFNGCEDPKPLTNCDQQELLIVVKGLLAKIGELEEVLAISNHRQAAMEQLL